MLQCLRTFTLTGLFGVLIAVMLGGIGRMPAVAQTAQNPQPLVEQPAILSSELSPINRLLPLPLATATEVPALTPIYLDGRQLFFLSAPALEDERAVGQPPTAVRAQAIQTRLNEMARQLPRNDLNALPAVSVRVDEPSTLPVIFVGAQPLLTVTTLDAQFSGYPTPSELANVFKGLLERAFERYVQERSPAAFRQQSQSAFTVFAVAVIAQVFIRQCQKKVRQRQIRLMSDRSEINRKSLARTEASPTLSVSNDDVFESVIEQIRARLDNRQKRKLNEALRNLLWIAQIALWVASLFLVLNLYPQSRWLATLLLTWIQVPARILAIAGVAYLSVRLSSVLIEKGVFALQEGTQWAPDQSQRLSLRFSTFLQVAKGIAGSVILGISIMFMLATAGIEIRPLLAGAGIAGIAVSLAAQSLIKDIINGFLILVEDQFGVGDVIATGGVSGMVESLNLRITQLRDTEGRLITIPNSQISTVQNLSMDWAQVDLSLTVSHQSDLAGALTLLKEVATGLSQEAEWQRLILEPPEVLGVESLDHRGITLRLWLKTQPLKQWVVARELRQRIKFAFDQKGIEIGIPQEGITVLKAPVIPAASSAQVSGREGSTHSD
ncbi:MAG: mechanosensitive ion channel family protein [Cyanobacteria bacterium P01_D01_bin.105]